MFSHRNPGYWNIVSENEIWKDRVRTENKARNTVDRWQFLHAEYQQLYSRTKNVPRSTSKKSVNFNRIPEKSNVRRKGSPETTANEIGWRVASGNKLEIFGVNIRGLKTKGDMYKTFKWPHN